MSRILFVTSKKWRKFKGKDYQTPPLGPPNTFQLPLTPPDTPRHPQTLPYHPWHILDISKGSHRHSPTFLTPKRHLLTPSFLPESPLTSFDNSSASQTVWIVLGSGQGCSWGTGECVSGAWGCFGVFSGVLGLFEGVGGLRGVSGSLLPSFPFNVRKSQMRILNFFSRPEDPKCLKYQNVPNLGSFWAIGKPWERFQSWEIRIYFNSVPNDHTVPPPMQMFKQEPFLFIHSKG